MQKAGQKNASTEWGAVFEHQRFQGGPNFRCCKQRFAECVRFTDESGFAAEQHITRAGAIHLFGLRVQQNPYLAARKNGL